MSFQLVISCKTLKTPFNFQYSICLICLLVPGAFPDEDGGFGPHPGAHGYSCPKHGEQINLFHHQAGTVLDGAFWDGLVDLIGDGHVGFTPVITENTRDDGLKAARSIWMKGAFSGRRAERVRSFSFSSRRAVYIFEVKQIPIWLASTQWWNTLTFWVVEERFVDFSVWFDGSGEPEEPGCNRSARFYSHSEEKQV